MSKKLFVTEFSVRNFRSLKKFEAHNNFGQINLITGENNSGKTTLLEALFLNLGPTNPSLWFNVNLRRGLDRTSPEQSTAPYLFHRMDISNPIIFQIKSLNYPDSELRINYLEPTSYEIPQTSNGLETSSTSQKIASTDTEESVTVELTFTAEGSEPIETKAIILPKRMEIKGAVKLYLPESIYISTGTQYGLEEQAKRYDQLNRADLTKIYEELLRRTVLPELKRTSLGIENDKTIIHGDVGFGMVPLALLGSGTVRLNTILLALAYFKDGIVLIDEIENSFHHSILDKVWVAIAELIENDGPQIFATTHSDECIEAAFRVFKKKDHLDFRLHRLDKKTDKTDIFTFNKQQLEAALDTGWDVR